MKHEIISLWTWLLQKLFYGNALEIPWTKEAGGLQFMGVVKVGHDLATKPSPLYGTVNKNSHN